MAMPPTYNLLAGMLHSLVRQGADVETFKFSMHPKWRFDMMDIIHRYGSIDATRVDHTILGLPVKFDVDHPLDTITLAKLD